MVGGSYSEAEPVTDCDTVRGLCLLRSPKIRNKVEAKYKAAGMPSSSLSESWRSASRRNEPRRGGRGPQKAKTSPQFAPEGDLDVPWVS